MKMYMGNLKWVTPEYVEMVTKLKKAGGKIADSLTKEQAEAFFLVSRMAEVSMRMYGEVASDVVSALGSDLKSYPSQADALHMTGALFGEVGELYDIIKRWAVYGKPIDMEHLVEEVGDALFYLVGIRIGGKGVDFWVQVDDCASYLLSLCKVLGVDAKRAMVANMDKLGKRYENYEYTDERARERADKQG